MTNTIIIIYYKQTKWSKLWHPLPPLPFISALECSAVHCIVPKTRGGSSLVWVQSAEVWPHGWGQVLACARTCPPAHWMWRPTSPSCRDPCPESHSQYCSDYPAIILSLGYYLLFLFVSGIRLSENLLIGWQKSFTFLPDCSMNESDKWPTPATAPRTWTSDDTQLLFDLYYFLTWMFEFLCLTIWFVRNKELWLFVSFHLNNL